MKITNIFATSGIVGIGLAVGAYGGGLIAGYPNAGALAYLGFGMGVVLGVFIAGWLWQEKPHTNPPPEVGVKPVEILWREEETGRITKRRVLRSVTDIELRAVAVKVIHYGANVTYRSLRDELSEEVIAALQAELTEKRLARWRSYDENNQPNRQQGITLTDDGMRVMREALRQSPIPSYGEWQKTRTVESHT